MAGTANLKTKIPAQYAPAYAKVPVIAPKIATGEQLRSAAPDFVVAGSSDLYTKDRAGTREELAALKVPTFVSAVDCPQQNQAVTSPFEQLFSDHENLGKVFGAEQRAGKLVADQRAAVAKAGENASKVPAKRDPDFSAALSPAPRGPSPTGCWARWRRPAGTPSWCARSSPRWGW